MGITIGYCTQGGIGGKKVCSSYAPALWPKGSLSHTPVTKFLVAIIDRRLMGIAPVIGFLYRQ